MSGEKPLIPVGIPSKRKAVDANLSIPEETKQENEPIQLFKNEEANKFVLPKFISETLFPQSNHSSLLDILIKRLLDPSESKLKIIREEEERIAKALLVDPPCEEISELGGNSYLQIGYLIKRMNEVYGPNNYRSEVKKIEMAFKDTTSNGKAKLTYTCWMRVTVISPITGKEFYAEDVGTGVGMGEFDKAADTGIKSARTDAFKRCVKDFGPTFGSLLYSNEQRKRVKKDKQAPKK